MASDTPIIEIARLRLLQTFAKTEPQAEQIAISKHRAMLYCSSVKCLEQGCTHRFSKSRALCKKRLLSRDCFGRPLIKNTRIHTGNPYVLGLLELTW